MIADTLLACAVFIIAELCVIGIQWLRFHS
jgi:hypothetical protein